MISRRHSNSGFTMLEVLISIVILAFGLLGIAGLQVFALANSQNASQRLTATALANDMADRLKTNMGGVDSGSYNAPNLSSYKSRSGCTAVGANCTPEEAATNDLFEWQNMVAANLPNGVGIVCRDSTPDDGANASSHGCDNNGIVMYVIKIWWSDDRATKSGAGQTQRFWTAINP